MEDFSFGEIENPILCFSPVVDNSKDESFGELKESASALLNLFTQCSKAVDLFFRKNDCRTKEEAEEQLEEAHSLLKEMKQRTDSAIELLKGHMNLLQTYENMKIKSLDLLGFHTPTNKKSVDVDRHVLTSVKKLLEKKRSESTAAESDMKKEDDTFEKSLLQISRELTWLGKPKTGKRLDFATPTKSQSRTPVNSNATRLSPTFQHNSAQQKREEDRQAGENGQYVGNTQTKLPNDVHEKEEEEEEEKEEENGRAFVRMQESTQKEKETGSDFADGGDEEMLSPLPANANLEQGVEDSEEDAVEKIDKNSEHEDNEPNQRREEVKPNDIVNDFTSPYKQTTKVDVMSQYEKLREKYLQLHTPPYDTPSFDRLMDRILSGPSPYAPPDTVDIDTLVKRRRKNVVEYEDEEGEREQLNGQKENIVRKLNFHTSPPSQHANMRKNGGRDKETKPVRQSEHVPNAKQNLFRSPPNHFGLQSSLKLAVKGKK